MKNKIIAALLCLASMNAHAQLIAVNTDVAMDVLMMPSLGFELVTGNRSSIGVNAMMVTPLKPWWNKDKMSGVAVQPEYRYYFSGRPISKFFIGLGGLGSIYNVIWRGKVYDGYALGGGITYGYVWNLTPHLNIDFHSGFGAVFYRRKEYFVNDNYDVDYTIDGGEHANAKGYYLLPTRFGISVTYIFK